MKLSEQFNLGKTQFELDFIDIDPDEDFPLFLDPYFISKANTEFGRNANDLLKDFFHVLLRNLADNNIEAAQEQFSYLGEANELCLGLSKENPAGKGMGKKDATRIFKELVKSKALKSGLLEDIEDFRIFVHNVGKDKISDMTANIIKSLLIKYTKEQCELWGIPLYEGVPTGEYWNKDTHSWENGYDKGLICDGKKILLVPKRYVSYSKAYCVEKYVRNKVLPFLQNEHLRLNTSLVKTRKDGTPYVNKKDIEAALAKEAKKDWLIRFTSEHKDIFEDFKRNAINEINPISNEELTDVKLLDVCEHLESKLKELPPGGEHATTYQRLIAGIFSLLFYPLFSCLRLEESIHDGRKRIDITFDNCAEKGFFSRLLSIHNIPASLIMIECKNYSKDIANPEIDQLIGRFNDKRGRFGFLLSRMCSDRDKIIKRCQDAYADNGNLVFPIVDEDLVNLLKKFPNEGQDCVEEFLNNMFHDIITN